MTKRRTAAGGGVTVEVAPDRLIGWVNRFAGRNSGLAEVIAHPSTVTVISGDGTTAVLPVPFGPMELGEREPLEALLHHLSGVGALGIILIRGGAHSVGVQRDGVVLSSSTDRAHLQGRTAAGGWSQQRYARRRANQRTAAYESAATTAARILVPVAGSLRGMVYGGDRGGLDEVLSDGRLAGLTVLPHRNYPDIAEPRRVVLDEIARRCLSIDITIRSPAQQSIE
jgi:Actinobacteria/chloroflexi VLRF1 release factor